MIVRRLVGTGSGKWTSGRLHKLKERNNRETHDEKSESEAKSLKEQAKQHRLYLAKTQ